jgi:hypothetical protein
MAKRERKIEEGARPFDKVTATLDEGAAVLAAGVNGWKRQLETHVLYRKLPTPALVAADLGLGKTEQVLLMIGDILRRYPHLRGVYVVPSHRLGEDILARFQTLCPDIPCQLYLGNGRPDPDHPDRSMCWRIDEMELLLRAHGTMGTLCKSCPFRGQCGRTRIAVNETGLVILAGPATLIKAAPAGFKRLGQRPADFIVVDELAPSDWLEAENHEIDATPLRPFPGTDPAKLIELKEAAAEVANAMRALEAVIDDLPPGRVTRECAVRIEWLRDWGVVRRQALKLKAEPRRHLSPSMSKTERMDMLEELAKHNRRVMQIRRLTLTVEQAAEAMWTVVSSENVQHPDGHKSVRVTWHEHSGLLKVNEDGSIRLRWRGRIANDWRRTPLLLLDGTPDTWTLQRWFPDLRVIAEARVAEPDCVFRLQCWDDEFTYSSTVPREEEPPPEKDQRKYARNEHSRWNRARQIARLLEVMCRECEGQGRDGIDVLAIVPEQLEEALQYLFAERGGPPSGLAIEHFNNIRGVDKYGGVRSLITVSRLLPATPVLEEMAETITGVGGITLGGEPLPYESGAYAMRDETGRAVTEARAQHPDPVVQRVLAQLDAERLQAHARARGIRRTPANPVSIIDLTCRPLPVELDEMRSAEDIFAVAHLARWLVAMRVIPELGEHGSREFLAAVVGGTPKAVEHALARDPTWREVLTEASTEGMRRFGIKLGGGQRYAAPVWIEATTPAEAIERLRRVGVTAVQAEYFTGNQTSNENAHCTQTPLDISSMEFGGCEADCCQFDFFFGGAFGQPLGWKPEVRRRGGRRAGAGRPRNLQFPPTDFAEEAKEPA